MSIHTRMCSVRELTMSWTLISGTVSEKESKSGVQEALIYTKPSPGRSASVPKEVPDEIVTVPPN